MAGVVRATLYYLQRVDAYLLEVLHQNVRRMQERGDLVPPAPQEPPVGPFLKNEEIPSWTGDGIRRMDLTDPNIVALQVAPWTFVTSSYAISLIIMAIVLSRIQHVVAPVRDLEMARLQSAWPQFFPIDVSKTRTRLVIRLFSLFLIWKSTICLTVIVLQAWNVYPSIGPLALLGHWASMINMVDVCWSAFISVCAAMIASTFTRAMDGTRTSSTFNLPQFAFVLHVCSAPLGSVYNRMPDPLQGQRPALRPNRHVLVTLFLPLLQIAMLHTQGIWKKYERNVFIPTAVCGILGLVHFVYAYLIGQIMEYPLLQIFPSALELSVVALILCTTALNAFSQFLQHGRIVRPLFGTGANSLPAKDEEWAISVMRLGTSAVDLTVVAGLGNEVAAVSTKPPQENTVYLGMTGVERMTVSDDPTKGRKVPNPFGVEIKQVRAATPQGEMWINIAWMKELSKFSIALWRFAKTLWKIATTKSKEENSAGRTSPNTPSRSNTPFEHSPSSGSMELYSRFLAGDAISDHESVFEGSGDELSSEAGSSDTESTPYSRMHSVEPTEHSHADETSQLFSEHSQRASTPLAPVLLAHLTTSSSSPLTRRRYTSLIQGIVHREHEDMPTPRAQPYSYDDEDEAEKNRRLCEHFLTTVFDDD
ncbi:hypothetical protein FRC17_011318 [Serendipita sp. 399]|nr:hypothetical protein FRC17_011318 [Serendipita sp. 399]